MPKRVYINTIPENAGRQEHGWTTWSDLEIVLSAISKQSLTGTVFYFQIETEAGVESDWYGPLDIYKEETATISLNKEISSLINKYLSANKLLNLQNSLEIVSSNNSILEALLQVQKQFSILNTKTSILNSTIYTDYVLDLNSSRNVNISALLQLSYLKDISGFSWDTFKNVYINSEQSDVGRQSHSFVSWTDTEIVLSAINKHSIAGNTFYFKVESETGESNWYGPILIGEVYSELVNLLTSVSISNISDIVPPSETIINAILNINYQLQNVYQGYELGTALVNISKNVSLDVETQAVLNAVLVLLKSKIISPEQFGSVLNAIVSLDKSYISSTSFFEPPTVHKVKFIRLRIIPESSP